MASPRQVRTATCCGGPQLSFPAPHACEALECGSLLPLFRPPACWRPSADLFCKSAAFPSPSRAVCEALDCGSLLPLFRPPPCWRPSADLFCRSAAFPSPSRAVCEALECGSLLPLFRQPACWRPLFSRSRSTRAQCRRCLKTPRASSRNGKRQQAAALQSFARPAELAHS